MICTIIRNHDCHHTMMHPAPCLVQVSNVKKEHPGEGLSRGCRAVVGVQGVGETASSTYVHRALAALFLGTDVVQRGQFNPIGGMVGNDFIETGTFGPQLHGYRGWIDPGRLLRWRDQWSPSLWRKLSADVRSQRHDVTTPETGAPSAAAHDAGFDPAVLRQAFSCFPPESCDLRAFSPDAPARPVGREANNSGS